MFLGWARLIRGRYLMGVSWETCRLHGTTLAWYSISSLGQVLPILAANGVIEVHDGLVDIEGVYISVWLWLLVACLLQSSMASMVFGGPESPMGGVQGRVGTHHDILAWWRLKVVWEALMQLGDVPNLCRQLANVLAA